MDLKWILTSFEGRMRRRDYWLGFVAMIVLSLLLGLVLSFIVGPEIGGILGTVILLYPVAALLTKRMHDREKGANPWLLVFLGIPMLANLMAAGGIGFEAVPSLDGGPGGALPSNAIGYVVGLAAVVVGLWGLVEFGFLRGTRGSNRFGADPVTGAAPEPATVI